MSHPNNPELWDVQAMMEDAVKQIARRYNLNDAQENYTRLLLVKKTTAFLQEHEKDIRELLKESIDLRLGVIKGDADIYKRWAERAAPIYESAKEAILDGNMEWRNVLDEEQIKTHDLDLSLMKTQFEQVSRTLDTWRGGGGPSGALSRGVAGGGPQQRSELGQPQTVIQMHPEDQWLAYVNKFIQTYHFDEKQSIAAREKIHKEMHGQARKYREKQQKEFEKINEVIKTDPKKIKPSELVQRRQDLEKPIRDLFVDMHQRLMQLATGRQIAAADAQLKVQLEALYRTLAGPTPRDAKDMKKDTEGKGGAADQKSMKATPVGSAESPKPSPMQSKSDKAGESAKAGPSESKSESSSAKPAAEPTSKPND
jgi:hypothetical protein